MILNSETKKGFIWIPKCAGHSITDVLFNNGFDFHVVSTEYNHVHALPYKEYYQDFQDHFVFCFVRNPWDRMLSYYSYLTQVQGPRLPSVVVDYREEDWNQGFTHWLTQTECHFYMESKYKTMPVQKRPQSDYFTDENGKTLVQFIGRIERVHQDFAVVSKELGITEPLDHLNLSEHGDYQEIYDNTARDFVEQWHQDDITRFGYKF
jgi:hypothetical protein